MARVQADRLNLVVTAVTAQSQHSHSTVTATSAQSQQMARVQAGRLTLMASFWALYWSRSARDTDRHHDGPTQLAAG